MRNLSETNMMKIIVFGFLLSLMGCATSSEKTSIENNSNDKAISPENRKLSPVEAYEMIKNDTGIVILDVRTPDEYNNGHIDQAVNIDFFAEDFKDNIQKLDKEKTYMVYCMGGKRSNQAQLLMDSLKIKVFDMTGGFQQWSSEHLPYKQKE